MRQSLAKFAVLLAGFYAVGVGIWMAPAIAEGGLAAIVYLALLVVGLVILAARDQITEMLVDDADADDDAIVSAVVRGVAFLMIVHAIGRAPQIVSAFLRSRGDFDPYSTPPQVLFVAALWIPLQILVGVLLLANTATFVTWLRGGAYRASEPHRIEPVLLATIALWVFLNDAPALAGSLFRAMQQMSMRSYMGNSPMFYSETLPPLIAEFLRITVAVLMFAGRDGVARWWYRIRPMNEPAESAGSEQQ